MSVEIFPDTIVPKAREIRFLLEKVSGGVTANGSLRFELFLRLDHNRQIGVHVTPCGKEIILGLAASGYIAGKRRRTRHAEICEGIQRREGRVASVIADLLKFTE